MKKDRNCGMNPYPVYQPMQPGIMQPNMIQPGFVPQIPFAGNMQPNMMQTIQQDSVSSNTIEQQMNQLQRQINNLESRVSKLESSFNTIGNNSFSANQYSNGNYHIV